MSNTDIPINNKPVLTPKEASQYSSIGINKIHALSNSPYCTFALQNGNRILVKRKEFEEYISQTDTIDL